MPSATRWSRLLKLFEKHSCLLSYHKNSTMQHSLWIIPWLPPYMPCIPQSQPHYRPCLEDSCSLKNFFLNVPLVVDCHAILACWEQLVNDKLLCANKKHFNFDYQVGQKVLKHDKWQTLRGKLKPKTTGPFEILLAHSDRPVTILLRPGITEHVNTWCTLPYWEPTPL